MISVLKVPGTKRLKLEYDELRSSFAVAFTFGCYVPAAEANRQGVGGTGGQHGHADSDDGTGLHSQMTDVEYFREQE
jgi:hypothetical protein